MHPVEGQVEHAGHLALDVHAAAGQVAHQIADGGVAAEIDQRTVVVVDEGHRLAIVQAVAEGLEQGVCLLVRSLGPWGNRQVGIRLRTGSAVAEGEDIGILGGLQGLFHHQLIAPVHLQTFQLGQEGRGLDARCPDGHFRG